MAFLYMAGTSEARPMITSCKTAQSCKLSCNQKNGAACTKLGLMYSNGELVQPNKKRAATLFRQACDLSYSWACWELSRLYRDGWMFAVPQRPNQSRRLANKAQSLAAQGCAKKRWYDCRTQAELDLAKLKKDGWPKDKRTKEFVTKTLIPRTRKACTQGKSVDNCLWLHENVSQLRWRANYIESKEQQSLRRSAVAQFQASCNAGDTRACVLAVDAIRHSEPKKAMRYASMACQAGSSRGCFMDAALRLRRTKDKTVTKRLVNKILQSCELGEHEDCGELVSCVLPRAQTVRDRQGPQARTSRARAHLQARQRQGLPSYRQGSSDATRSRSTANGSLSSARAQLQADSVQAPLRSVREEMAAKPSRVLCCARRGEFALSVSMVTIASAKPWATCT